mgnify:CR=1 FL=1
MVCDARWRRHFRAEGSKNRKLFFQPIISVGRGGTPRFSSRNDNPSFAIYDTDVLRAGVVGKFLPGRDAGTDNALQGLSEIKWGGELGGFADIYVTDYLRARAELRQGIRSHDGLVADIAVDAFTDVAPGLRVSAGPRMTYATSGYTQAYYGVNASESAASGLSQYDPDGGITSYGAGGAITWDALPPEMADEIQVMITTSRASRSNRGGRRIGAGRTSQNASA